jgi:L-sorbose 1-phosphate reductase
MKTTALRLYGADDLRLETFDLPPIGDDEILADVVSDSICMSTYKAATQGARHKRVPDDVDRHPVIVGHEFSGTLLEVGRRWRDRFRPGDKYSIQPAMAYPGRELEAPGYSFPYIGGNATKIVIPREIMEMDCLLPYEGEGYFKASLSEPMSCIVGAFHTQYHFKAGTYDYRNGIEEGGSTAILAGAGPMGLGAVDYALHGPRKPALLAVTDVDPERLRRAAEIFSVAEARRNGVDLHYVPATGSDPVGEIKSLNQGRGYHDVFVFAPIKALVEQASALLGFNGCLNFFAGPSQSDFSATINFYDVHYSGHHVVGSSGGNTDDMREALSLMAQNKLDPSVMITHVGGLDAVADAIRKLPSLPGSKKLIYNAVSLPLTALADFRKLGESDPFFAELAEITEQNGGLWSVAAELLLLERKRTA